MIEWESVKVGELGRIVTGKTPKTSAGDNFGGDIPFLTPSDDMSKKYVSETKRTLSRKGVQEVKNCILPEKAVCVSCIGSDLGKAIITTRPTVTNQQINSIIVDETQFDPDFVYYSMIILGRKLNYISKTSTAVPIVNKSSFSDYTIPVPTLNLQRKLSSMLNALDCKITLNTQANDKLQQVAQALFTSWFVDFGPFDEPFTESPVGTLIPKSLEMVQVEDLPHCLETGKRPKGGAVTSGIPSIGAENVKQLGEVNFASNKFIPFEFASRLKTGKVNGYELMLYKDGGKPGTFTPHFSMFGEGFPYEEFFINEHVFKLDFGNRGFNEFAYFYFQTEYPYNWLSNNGGKAAIPGINRQDVNSVWIYSPDYPTVKKFCEWVQPIFTSILSNCAQNVKLAHIRDTLLPRLMSGELDVSELDL